MPLTNDDYVFFWKPTEPHGWASQWYPSPFKVEVEGFGAVRFATAEHWMMFQKALLFNDAGVAHEVIAMTGTSGGKLAQVKALGRKVAGFDEATWNENRSRIVLEGSLHKYQQNEELREALLATGAKKLVEASPRDRIWGVGYGYKNALKMKEQWGLNLLGKALEEAREQLKAEPSSDN
ncbi:DUF1768-domain-containing protein [Hymenopellis radicata]|nr:DUF1768-domain-containing protein [Hymenopellis radicata]